MDKTLIIVAGPTGVGKTHYAINLAQQFNTEIISCDSRQFYKEMTIGTAVPNAEELLAVKHHFIQHKSINDYYNISLFEHEALDLLDKLFVKHSTVIMTGGSGLYIDVICNGIAELPDADLELRKNLKQEYCDFGIEYIQEKLKDLDIDYYNMVDKFNPNRMLRAIEVCIQTEKKYSEIRNFKPKERDFKIEKICLSRNKLILDERINNRVDEMIDNGLIDEAKSLFPFRNLQTLNTVGYKELFMHFDGTYTLTEAIAKIKTSTRQYAKRQLTWFRKDADYKWINL